MAGIDPLAVATKGFLYWNEDPLNRATMGWIKGVADYLGGEIIALVSGILRTVNLRSNV
jgi:hypothetical protein